MPFFAFTSRNKANLEYMNNVDKKGENQRERSYLLQNTIFVIICGYSSTITSQIIMSDSYVDLSVIYVEIDNSNCYLLTLLTEIITSSRHVR